MANYTVTKQWQDLSTIMGADYDATKKYRVHNNCELPAKLCLTEETSPTASVEGRVYPPLCEIYIDVNLNPSLRVVETVETNPTLNVEISEVIE